MPCHVERYGRDYFWFCCYCRSGPYLYWVNRACVGCNDHEFCNTSNLSDLRPSDATSDASHMLSPPATPPSSLYATNDLPTKAAESADPPENVPPNSPTSFCSNKSAGIPQTRDYGIGEHSAIGTSDRPAAEQWQTLDEAIEHSTVTIRNFQLFLTGLVDIAHNPAYKSCPSRGNNANYRRSSLQTSSSKQPRGKHRPGNGRKGHVGREDDPDSDAERPDQQEDFKHSPGSNHSPGTNYACPFFKHNPHRWRHVISCNRGYELASDLREHLTRKESPHKLYKCSACHHIFPDQKTFQEHQKSGQTCQVTDPFYPAEGVVSGEIPSLRRPHVNWWNDVYRLLFGQNIEPPSCDYDPSDVARSNEPGRQGHFRDLLVQTLQRGLPEDKMDTYLRYHCLSTLQSEIYRITRLLGGEDEQSLAHHVLSRSMDIVRSRRVTRDAEQRRSFSTQDSAIDPIVTNGEEPTSPREIPDREIPIRTATESSGSLEDTTQCNGTATSPSHDNALVTECVHDGIIDRQTFTESLAQCGITTPMNDPNCSNDVQFYSYPDSSEVETLSWMLAEPDFSNSMADLTNPSVVHDLQQHETEYALDDPIISGSPTYQAMHLYTQDPTMPVMSWPYTTDASAEMIDLPDEVLPQFNPVPLHAYEPPHSQAEPAEESRPKKKRKRTCGLGYDCPPHCQNLHTSASSLPIAVRESIASPSTDHLDPTTNPPTVFDPPKIQEFGGGPVPPLQFGTLDGRSGQWDITDFEYPANDDKG